MGQKFGTPWLERVNYASSIPGGNICTQRSEARRLREAGQHLRSKGPNTGLHQLEPKHLQRLRRPELACQRLNSPISEAGPS